MKKRFVIAFVMGLLGVGAAVKAQEGNLKICTGVQCGCGCLAPGLSCPDDCPSKPVHDIPCALQPGVIYKIPQGTTFLCESGSSPKKILSTTQNGEETPEHYSCPSSLPLAPEGKDEEMPAADDGKR